MCGRDLYDYLPHGDDVVRLCLQHYKQVFAYARQLHHTDGTNPGSRQAVGRKIWEEAQLKRKRQEAD